MRIEILKDGEVVNTILATPEFAQQHYPDAWRLAEQQDAPYVPPQVVITSITADAQHAAGTTISADWLVVDTSTGATLTFTAQIQGEGGAVLPVDQTFRMPLVAADGSNDRRLIRVNFVQGVAQFDVALSTSRHWRVDEAVINQSLQPHERLTFAGLDVYVLE